MNFLKRLLKMPKPANKPVIAVDVDDVLAAERDAVREFVNATYGTSHTEEDYSVDGSYARYWERVWGVDSEEGGKRYQAYLEAHEKIGHQTVDGAIKAINKLKKNYNLAVITSREDVLIDTTHSWLEKHFPKTFSHIEFAVVWSKDYSVSKARIAKELKASYIVDDNPDHCNLAQEGGIQALLFGDYGWNRNAKLTEGIIRVKNWQEVLEYFDAKG
jgi:uncharacterized HAD superfamily protein